MASTITYLDSHVPENTPDEYGQEYAALGLRFIQDEHLCAFGCPDQREWTLVGSTQDTVPQQINGYDCGVYTCLFIDCLMQDRPMTLTPAQVHGARAHMALAIIRGQAPPWEEHPPPT